MKDEISQLSSTKKIFNRTEWEPAIEGFNLENNESSSSGDKVNLWKHRVRIFKTR